MSKVAVLAVMAMGLLAGHRTAAASTAVTWECPEDYQVHEGLNVGFPHKGLQRSFWLYPPA
jgi:hypothetical protein